MVNTVPLMKYYECLISSTESIKSRTKQTRLEAWAHPCAYTGHWEGLRARITSSGTIGELIPFSILLENIGKTNTKSVSSGKGGLSCHRNASRCRRNTAYIPSCNLSFFPPNCPIHMLMVYFVLKCRF